MKHSNIWKNCSKKDEAWEPSMSPKYFAGLSPTLTWNFFCNDSDIITQKYQVLAQKPSKLKENDQKWHCACVSCFDFYQNYSKMRGV